MASVTIDHIYKKFGEVSAVNDVSIDIQDKEFLVLVGPSGCGKTTTLRLVAGLEELSAGNIFIGDRKVNDVAPKDRDIAMVFQSYALYPHMSVYDNLSFGLRLRKTPKAEIEKRVKDAAAILGIGELLNRKPKQLSGGQRQRVALGRAIVREPQVFLMDEPLSNLDAKLRVQTRAELIKLHQRIETTVIYVTHDQVEAMTMGTRLAVMRDGVVQQLGTPQECYDHPTNVFVAGFIGSPAMNFFRGRLTSSNGTTMVDTGAFTVPLPPEKVARLGNLTNQDVIMGLRPEDVNDHRFRPGDDSSRVVTANVEVVEHMGAEVFVYLMARDSEFLARFDSRSTAHAGEPLEVVFNMDKVHLFDPTTEKSLL